MKLSNGKPSRNRIDKDLTREEFDKIIEQIPIEEKKYELALKIAYYLGLRGIEIVSIQEQDIGIRTKTLVLRTAKNNNIDVQDIPINLFFELYDYIQENKNKFIDGFIFPPEYPKRYERANSKHITRDLLNRKLREYCIRANINDYYSINNGSNHKLYRISLHTLRHAYGSNFYVASGFDIIATMRALRHTDARATSNYIHTGTLQQRRLIHEKMFNKINEERIIQSIWEKEIKN